MQFKLVDFMRMHILCIKSCYICHRYQLYYSSIIYYLFVETSSFPKWVFLSSPKHNRKHMYGLILRVCSCFVLFIANA